jgi:hypothetical protein
MIEFMPDIANLEAIAHSVTVHSDVPITELQVFLEKPVKRGYYSIYG